MTLAFEKCFLTNCRHDPVHPSLQGGLLATTPGGAATAAEHGLGCTGSDAASLTSNYRAQGITLPDTHSVTCVSQGTASTSASLLRKPQAAQGTREYVRGSLGAMPFAPGAPLAVPQSAQ